MFRLQENVPEIYTKASRDFQLFCRTYDILTNAIRYSIKSTDYLLNPLMISDKMLPLLATRVGFFPKSDYNTYALRLIISAFPYMMKYKGSKKGIEIALYTILKAEENYKNSIVRVINDKENNRYEIHIYTEKAIINENLLRDVLSYILPIGYELVIGTYRSENAPSTTQINVLDSPLYTAELAKDISMVISSNQIGNNIDYSADPQTQESVLKNAIGSYTTMEVLSAEDLELSTEDIDE